VKGRGVLGLLFYLAHRLRLRTEEGQLRIVYQKELGSCTGYDTLSKLIPRRGRMGCCFGGDPDKREPGKARLT